MNCAILFRNFLNPLVKEMPRDEKSYHKTPNVKAEELMAKKQKLK